MAGFSDTIAAIATSAGRAGIGVVRISGMQLAPLAIKLTGRQLVDRFATLCTFLDRGGAPIDRGIAIYFAAPHSYTGEDVIELQGHGGSVVLQLLLQRCMEMGARHARPGEFTQRAFLNDKLDLAQAESVADLIDAASHEAARSAARSLTGEFSNHIHVLVKALIDLRVQVETWLDFPEEEIDALEYQAQRVSLESILLNLSELLRLAKQGAALREGLSVVLIGRPNVGKSSLLNILAQEDIAIVTPIPGTTRDLVHTTITLAGVPIHLIDTAGLRDAKDQIEQLGIERTWQALGTAGAALLITEEGESLGAHEAEIIRRLPDHIPFAWVYNKIDLYNAKPSLVRDDKQVSIRLSALSGEGVGLLRDWLLEAAGWLPQVENGFIARDRHLHALREAQIHLFTASNLLQQNELFAEELRQAQNWLASITGEFSPDDLLGEIFSRFCIGK
jgi:tRNA modification GTPase